MNKTIAIGLIGILILLSACETQEQKNTKALLANGVPPYTIALLKLGSDCDCVLNDDKSIECTCKNKDWNADASFKCRKMPTSHYDAVIDCYGSPIKK